MLTNKEKEIEFFFIAKYVDAIAIADGNSKSNITSNSSSNNKNQCETVHLMIFERKLHFWR